MNAKRKLLVTVSASWVLDHPTHCNTKGFMPNAVVVLFNVPRFAFLQENKRKKKKIRQMGENSEEETSHATDS
jgi:hypothetical protein